MPVLLRRVIAVAAMGMLLGSIAAVVAYVSARSRMPRLESRHDLELLLEANAQSRGASWRAPLASAYPVVLQQVWVLPAGCPGYFESPRHGGVATGAGLLWAAILSDDERLSLSCDHAFARGVSAFVGPLDPRARILAIHRVEQLLDRDEQVAFQLSLMGTEGRVGAESLAQSLFGRPVASLDLAQTVELAMALEGKFEALSRCTDAPRLLQARNERIDEASREGVVALEVARAAKSQRLSCKRP